MITYYGVNLYRAPYNGMWYTVAPRYMADTLDGLKALIRDRAHEFGIQLRKRRNV